MMINNGLTDRDTIGQTYTISANKSMILDLASLILQKKYAHDKINADGLHIREQGESSTRDLTVAFSGQKRQNATDVHSSA